MILISQTLFLGTPVAGGKNTRTVLHDVDGKRKVSVAMKSDIAGHGERDA